MLSDNIRPQQLVIKDVNRWLGSDSEGRAKNIRCQLFTCGKYIDYI